MVRVGVHCLCVVGVRSLVCIAWCALVVGWCTLLGEFVGVHCLVCIGWCELVGVRCSAGAGGRTGGQGGSAS